MTSLPSKRVIRKLMICPWFGPLPDWWKAYARSTHSLEIAGYDWLVLDSLSDFKDRVRTLLGVDCPIETGDAKIHDFRPAFGILFARELVGYDFWGHTDFDCVYGRVDHFMPDERLAELDVYSDHPSYLCGPWALYRNNRDLADVFMLNDDWRERLEEPTVSGWVETGFTDTVNAAGLRTLYELNHGYLHPERLAIQFNVGAASSLIEAGREISFFHFRRTKEWPFPYVR